MQSANSVLLLLLLAAAQAVLTGATDCGSYGYMYTLQPPEDIVCSPYNRGVLNLTCAVSGDLVADIHWYFQSAEEGSQASILTNSSQVTITHSEFDGDYSVIMIVEGLTAANEGFYWCQGLVWHQDQSLELSQSAVFELRPRDQYFPINCPNKALKSSEVRCAAVIPLPVVSSSGLPFHGHTSTFEVLLPTDESLGVGLDPSRTVPGHSFTVPTKLPTARPSPTSRPTVTDNTIGGDGTTDRPPTGPLTDTSATTAQPPLTQGTVQLSDIILYAILGLLGFLVVLVFSLSIVISILCCKKRHRNLQGKEAPYDQFSTESEPAPGTLTLKSLDSYPLAPLPPPPYRLPLHPSSTVTSSSSGVYDEIHTIMPHLAGQFPLYQEIPVVRMDSSTDGSTLNSEQEPTVRGSAGDSVTARNQPAVQQGRFDHPYDLPDRSTSHAPPTGPSHTAGSSTQQQQHKQSGYDSLEPASVLITEGADGRSSMGDSSDFTNSNLQVTPPPEDKASSTVAASSNHTGTVAVEIEPATQPSDLSCAEEGTLEEKEEEEEERESAATLPAFPENPYHILEDTRGARRDRTHPLDGRLGEYGTEPRPLRVIGRHLSLSEDEGYDRLVGPPHIYHILQKSPSLVRPRVVRECSPVSGYHRLDNRMDVNTSTSGNQQLPHCTERLQPLPSSTDQHNEENLNVSSSDIFDDPQYNFSPKRNLSGGGPTNPVQRNSHSGQVTTLERKRVERGGVDLSRYRGDYERDPLYMQLVQKLSDPVTCAGAECVFVHTKREKGGSNKSASLPDITHTYQSLQTLTRDPLTNYEMLHRRQLDANV